MKYTAPIPDLQTLVDRALGSNFGDPTWCTAKAQFSEDLAAIARRAPRMRLIEIDLRGDFTAVFKIDMPVPTWPDGNRLRIAQYALFGLQYQSAWRWEPFPGWAAVSLIEPRNPFAPNIAPAMGGAICLGQLTPGIDVSELVHLGYYAVSLQNRTLDETDPEGVLNAAACDFYRDRPHFLPLTYAGLYEQNWEPAHDWGDAIYVHPANA